MGLEKMGLPEKPSERGKSWTPDSTNCEGCHSAFSLWNRKHHCRRCGGLFCNNCTLQRQVLRGQGDAPVRICEACKKLDDATKMEMRYGKGKTPKGGSKASSKDNDTEALLKQLHQPDGRSQESDVDLDSILASVADTDSDEHEVEQAGGKRSSTKHKRQQSDNTFDRIGEDVEPLSPTKLHEQAQEEKKKYTALRKQGKDSEAMKAFKMAKELDRQAEAVEKEIKQRRRLSAGPSSPIVGQQSRIHPSKLSRDSLDSDFSSLSKERPEPVASGRKNRASTREQVTEKQTLNEKEDLLKDLKELGWTDKEIREAEKNPVAKTEEQLLAELAAEVRPKPDRPANSAAPGPEGAMSMQILAHKRQALALKREGKMAEAKEELRKAKILEKQVEEMAMLGQSGGEDEASDDDELHALIRGLEREEKMKGKTGKVAASQSIPEDLGIFANFVNDDDDAHVEVDEDDMDDPEMVAALRAMGWEEEAAGMERTHKPQRKVNKPTQPTGPTLKEQILARKRKALAFKREGKLAEARTELGEAKKLEQELERIGSANAAPIVAQPAEPVLVIGEGIIDGGDEIDGGEEKVEVTEEDMRDPEMMAALRAMGFGDDEPTPIHEPILSVLKPNPVDKATLQHEILTLKRQALALKREGRTTEAREELRHAKVLEQQLQDLQAVFQRQEEAPAMIKESRTIRRGVQALPALSGVVDLNDEGGGEEEDVDVTNADLLDPDIAAALAAVGWQEETESVHTVEQALHSSSKNQEHTSSADLTADSSLATSARVGKESLPDKAENKEPEPVSRVPVQNEPAIAPSNPVMSLKTKSQLQQELLGRKRKALALKREGKSEEARIELQESKLLEQQLRDLEKGPVASPAPTMIEPKQLPTPGILHPPQALEPTSKEDSRDARPLYLDDEPVDEEDVTEDDMQDPELLAALAGVGWQGEAEVSTKPTTVRDNIPTTLLQEPVQLLVQANAQISSVTKTTKASSARTETGKREVKNNNLLEFDWGDPAWHVKKTGKDNSTKNLSSKGSFKSLKENDEENPFEGEYGELGQAVGLAPPLMDLGSEQAPAAPAKQQNWHRGLFDLLSGDHFNSNENKEQATVEKTKPKNTSIRNHTDVMNDKNVKGAVDPEVVTAIDGSGKKKIATSTGQSQVKESGRGQPTIYKKPDRPPPSLPSSKPAELTPSQEKVSAVQESPNTQQEILALKRKALALKREGKAGEAREELRKAKLLERQLEQQGSQGASTSLNVLPVTGRVINPQHNRVEEVSSSAAVPSSRSELVSVVKTSPPAKAPGHKEQMQQQVRQTKDRMKLQQESLAHKRKSMGLRREGKIEEAEAEYELAKNLEKQMEDLDPMHGKEELGDVAGVEDLLDPQLLAALKGLGFKEGELAGVSEPKQMVKPPGQSPISNVGLSSRGSIGGSSVQSSKGKAGAEDEKQRLEERIRGDKLRAVQLKRAGKTAEALEMLRGAKRLEKQLLTLTS